ncbi:MAG: hypothetical protein ACFFCE_16215 [Promethearchaeota archaeon]
MGINSEAAKFVLLGVGLGALNLLFYYGFVAPFQKFGNFIAFFNFGLEIILMFLFAKFKDYLSKRKPPLTEEEQTQKYGGRVIFSMEKTEAVKYFYIFILIYIYVIIFVPIFTMPTGVAISETEAYAIIRSSTEVDLLIFGLMQFIFIPALHFVSIVLGGFGLEK